MRIGSLRYLKEAKTMDMILAKCELQFLVAYVVGYTLNYGKS